MSSIVRLAPIAALTLVLAACGGSGGSSGGQSSAAHSSVGQSSVGQSSAGQSSSGQSSVASSSSAPGSSVSSAASSSAPEVFTGVFVDSAVVGIGYRTQPGGFEGLTNQAGEYQFAEGDSVTFFIGELELPSAPAKGIVTPLDLAQTDDDENPVVVNIARLLQSLDEDGDPSNGITIPAAAAAAATGPVDFSQSAEAFASDSAVLNLVANSGSQTTTLVSSEAALAHLRGSLEQLQASLIGSWYYQDISDPNPARQFHIVISFLDEQRFVLITDENELDDDAGVDGYEVGTYQWNLRTGVVEFVVVHDTNGEWGVSTPCSPDEVFLLDVRGDTLYFQTDGDVGEGCDEAGDGPVRIPFQRLASAEQPQVGGWVIEGMDEGDFVVAAFTADGYYLHMQHTEADQAGNPGIERGTYTLNPDTQELRVTTQTDTNGQWGLSHPCGILGLEQSNALNCGENDAEILQTLTVEGDTAVFVSEADTLANGGEEDPVLLIRIGTAQGN